MDISNLQTIYKQLVEHMDEAVWIGDEHDTAVYVNPKFCSLLGYTLEEMTEKKSYDFMDAENADIVKRANNTERRQ